MDTFDTEYEQGCVATTEPDEEGNFSGLDSDGVACDFNVSMIVAEHFEGDDAEYETRFAYVGE